MQIFVKNFHGLPTIILEVEPSETIKNLKQKIEDKTGYPPYRLTCKGNQLENDYTFIDYNIQKEDIIYEYMRFY